MTSLTRKEMAAALITGMQVQVETIEEWVVNLGAAEEPPAIHERDYIGVREALDHATIALTNLKTAIARIEFE